MTKAEYLESIGYRRKRAPVSMIYDYRKLFDNVIMVISIQLGNFAVRILCIRSQKDIDNIQIAFDNVRRDFEEMQKYED